MIILVAFFLAFSLSLWLWLTVGLASSSAMTGVLAAFSTVRDSASLGCIMLNSTTVFASELMVVVVRLLRHILAALTPVFVCPSHVFKACLG